MDILDKSVRVAERGPPRTFQEHSGISARSARKTSGMAAGYRARSTPLQQTWPLGITRLPVAGGWQVAGGRW